MNAILVTGGAGYIGSHCCKALAAAGYQPVVYDNLSRGNKGTVKWGPLEQGDLQDGARLANVLKKYQPLAVMHFAAYAYVGESFENPLLYWHNNVSASLTLVEAAYRAGVMNLVFSSSCATYGAQSQTPLRVEAPQRPVNPYGNTKLAVEMLLRDMTPLGLQSAVLRYFNAAGADPDGEIGECHDPEPHLIPRILQVAQGRLPHLDIFGDDYPTPDGTCVRDYIHVSDLADAHVLALRHLLAGRGSVTACLGAGRGVSVRTLVAAAEHVTGHPIPVRVGPPRPGDAPFLVADATEAESLLGFVPSRSDLQTIIETAWRWECRSLPKKI